jgi:hypothetical protein
MPVSAMVENQASPQRDHRVIAMGFEIFVFFAFAASLVLAGFASGPVVARRAHVPARQRSHPYH